MIFPQILFLFFSWQLIHLTTTQNTNWISCDVSGNLIYLNFLTMSSKPVVATKLRSSRSSKQPTREIATKLDSFMPAPQIKRKEDRTILPSSSVSLPPANLSNDLSFQVVSNKRKRSGHPLIRESISPDRSKRTSREASPFHHPSIRSDASRSTSIHPSRNRADESPICNDPIPKSDKNLSTIKIFTQLQYINTINIKARK